MNVDHIFIHTIKVYRPDVSEDSVGTPVTEYDDLGTRPCRVDIMSSEDRVAMGLRDTRAATILIPPNADIESGDRLDYDGEIFEIIGPITDKEGMGILKRITAISRS